MRARVARALSLTLQVVLARSVTLCWLNDVNDGMRVAVLRSLREFEKR